MSLKYQMQIVWSQDDQAFLVTIPELPGCMADGETYEQAVINAQASIARWIETARELERPVPEPARRQA
jgi:predicted RNase H-like HicB family nuclease